MKKVLLATTALVAFAGAATADVSLSGSARFGLKWTDDVAVDPSTQLEKRVTLNIDMTTETDSGLELGARIRLRSDEQNAAGEAADTAVNGAVVYVKSGGLKLSVGNICGALECMPGVYAGTMGLNGNRFENVVLNTADEGYWGWTAYTSQPGGANGVEIAYKAGDFSAMLSYDNLNGGLGDPAPYDTRNRISAHLAYNFGDWTVALGVQEGDELLGVGDKTVLTVGGKLGDFGVGLAYADNNGTSKVTLNGSYSFGATTVSAFVSDDSSDGTGTLATVATDNPWGLGVSYDLGGASLVAGYTNDEVGVKRASAGIKFKF